MALSSEQPILVCGVPKSGTTLVGQLLSNHPDISIDYDIDPSIYFLEYVSKTQSDHFFFSAPKGTVIDQHNEYWLTDDLREWHRLNMTYYQGLHLSRSKAKRWGSSTCFTYLFRDLIWEWFPKAHFVMVERDPRDHWCSFKHLNIPRHPDRWRHFVDCRRAVPKPGDPRMSFVEYHEVVANPTLVFDVLGLETPRDYLTGTLEVLFARSYGLSGPETAQAVRSNGVLTSRVGRWKRDLSEDEVRRCTEAFPELCAHYDKVTP